MDLDLNEAASERRVAAARVARDLASEDDLVTLLGVAKHGLGELFDGECTIQLGIAPHSMSGGEPEWIPSEGLRDEVMLGLSGPPSPDVVSERPGIVLVPHSDSGVCRAWVQFSEPRRVTVEELIIGDLFAQAFAIAVDRLVSQDLAAKREVQLREAVEGQKVIGQATGIMMERHRLTATVAFELLRVASQNRNIKLREIARRVIDTGEEPDRA
ncbi:MAG TPA: ANTAR domain-containing protein [Propionicimonas sp.]|uniref:ANTAR domain-containing protein n=1 Tax=Propionicimonas sp. TaxID=1955623 RepID=UPI002F3F5226